MVGVKGINEFWQQIYIDACGGKSYLDCKISFDPTKLPKIEITIDGVVLKLVGEDYMAWIWADNKPESKKLESSVRSINSFTFTYDDCPSTATIVFGRMFMVKYRSTFRAAKNGDRMIAVEGVGKT
jgi:nitrate reductase NapE component